jgi:9-cis-beta-carotene 9',10'-cleaving dioxygenase
MTYLCCNEIVAGYSWKNKKLDPTFMNAAKGKELLPRLVQVNICLA